jgi:hypothetical protein
MQRCVAGINNMDPASAFRGFSFTVHRAAIGNVCMQGRRSNFSELLPPNTTTSVLKIYVIFDKFLSSK